MMATRTLPAAAIAAILTLPVPPAPVQAQEIQIDEWAVPWPDTRPREFPI